MMIGSWAKNLFGSTTGQIVGAAAKGAGVGAFLGGGISVARGEDGLQGALKGATLGAMTGGIWRGGKMLGNKMQAGGGFKSLFNTVKDQAVNMGAKATNANNLNMYNRIGAGMSKGLGSFMLGSSKITDFVGKRNIGRISRFAGAAGPGAVAGAVGGAAYGGVSNNESMFSGAFKGALLGAAAGGAYSRYGSTMNKAFNKIAGTHSTTAGKAAQKAHNLTISRGGFKKAPFTKSNPKSPAFGGNLGGPSEEISRQQRNLVNTFKTNKASDIEKYNDRIRRIADIENKYGLSKFKMPADVKVDYDRLIKMK